MAQTTMCDKIQTIGTNLQNNLNARGITCTFGNTNGHTIYDLAQLVNERNLKGIGDTNLKVIASNPYCVSGDTTDIIVLLRDGVGNPLINKSIIITDGTNIYNGITDINGLFTLFNQTITTTTTYTVSYGTEVASIKIQVIDVMIDYAVTNNKNTHWFVRSADTTMTVTVDDDGTNLSNSSTTTSVFYFANPQSVSGDTPSITIGDFVVECDVISTTYGSGSQIALLLQGLTNNFNLSSYTAPYHLKMEKTGTTVKQYVDDTLIRTTTISDRTNYYMGFQLYKTCSIKFKNYRIYTI